MKSMLLLSLVVASNMLFAQEETQTISDTIHVPQPYELFQFPTVEELVASLEAGQHADFIVFSPIPYSQEQINTFRKKYGVGFEVRGCAITPMDIARGDVHNQTIIDFLTEKFGDSWEEEMPHFQQKKEEE